MVGVHRQLLFYFRRTTCNFVRVHSQNVSALFRVSCAGLSFADSDGWKAFVAGQNRVCVGWQHSPLSAVFGVSCVLADHWRSAVGDGHFPADQTCTG